MKKKPTLRNVDDKSPINARQSDMSETHLQKRQECDRRRDLPNDGADVFANVFDALFFGLGIESDFFVHVNVELPSLQRLVRLDALQGIGG